MPNSSENRRHPRSTVHLPALLFSDGADVRCVVVNLSAGGAGVMLPGYVDWRRGLPNILDIAERGAFRVQVRWMAGNAMGLAFEDGEWAAIHLPEVRVINRKGD